MSSWACSVCTFANPANAQNCEICAAARPPELDRATDTFVDTSPAPDQQPDQQGGYTEIPDQGVVAPTSAAGDQHTDGDDDEQATALQAALALSMGEEPPASPLGAVEPDAGVEEGAASPSSLGIPAEFVLPAVSSTTTAFDDLQFLAQLQRAVELCYQAIKTRFYQCLTLCSLLQPSPSLVNLLHLSFSSCSLKAGW